eukprot:9901741-Heterocapsa_arctica.AAC.1
MPPPALEARHTLGAFSNCPLNNLQPTLDFFHLRIGNLSFHFFEARLNDPRSSGQNSRRQPPKTR